MNIINLSQAKFRDYAANHKYRNFGQTIEYTHLLENTSLNKIFLGLTDNEDNILAAALFLIQEEFPGFKSAFAPDGFLIDYEDTLLVKEFIRLVSEYLKNEKISYLMTNPMFYLKIYNRNNTMIKDNQGYLNSFINMGFKSVGYASPFAKYDIIINYDDMSSDTYKNFNRNTRRNIKEAMNMGITLHRGTRDEIEEAYKMFKKKTKHNLNYYSNLMDSYNTKDNKMEIFFARLDPKKFLINAQKLYNDEKERNEQIHTNLKKRIGHISEKLLNKKINSDSLLEKYSQILNYAIKLNSDNTDYVNIATSIVFHNNNEVYFLIDGYFEKYRQIHANHILKWAIISKYHSLGYNIFNLGEINMNYHDVNDKYYGMYLYKVGFGGNIIEYAPMLMLVINKTKFNTYTKLKKIIPWKKSY